jgi:PAS domain S-box-containing protein
VLESARPSEFEDQRDGILFRHTFYPILDEPGRIKAVVSFSRDITESRRAEVALRESQEDLARAQQVGQIGSWRLDVRRNVLVWSDENHRIFGVAKGTALTYETFLKIAHPDDRRYVDTQWQAGLRGEPYDIEHRIVVDGKVKWVREKAYLEFDQAGNLLGGFGITQDITERKRLEKELRRSLDKLEIRVQERTAELEKANESLRQLSSRLLAAHEEVRKRVACDLHDSVGSCLTAVKYRVENALLELGKTPNTSIESLRTVIPVLQESIQECRRMQQDLRPPLLDDLGLLATFSWFSRRFQTIYPHIRIEPEICVAEDDIPKDLKIVIYRITQEAMNNLAKHSRADLVRLFLEKRDDHLDFVIEDNGQGFELEKVLTPESTEKGLGLSSMRERAEFSGGSLRIESIKGKGTVIQASWPL